MAMFGRAVRIGAGLLALGFGVYRFTRGRRDWLTSTALTTGMSVTLGNLARGRRLRPRRTVARMVPQVLADFSMATLNTLR